MLDELRTDATRRDFARQLANLRRRIDLVLADAVETQRTMAQEYEPTYEAHWQLVKARHHLARARNTVWAAEEKLRND